MKLYISLIITLAIFAACEQPNNHAQQLEAKIDSLQNNLDKAYKPGFGEFMSSIQTHHAKLWFAGEAENWKLADFEMGEIKEALDGIKQYNADRAEAKSIPMIQPALDSIDNAIQQKDLKLFKSNYIFLTSTCNNCHRATNHEFNIIKVPTQMPFSNQVFKEQ